MNGLTTGMVPPYLRFSESINLKRTQQLKGLINKSNQPNNNFDTYHVTVRMRFGKCDSLTPQQPPPSGSRIDVFLGDSKHNPSMSGKATLLECMKTIWRYLGQNYPQDLKSLYRQLARNANSSIFTKFGGRPPNIDPFFWNNLDGETRLEIEKYLNIYYQNYNPALVPLKPESEISVFYLAF